MNNAKWTFGAIGYMCCFAYAIFLIVYQTAFTEMWREGHAHPVTAENGVLGLYLRPPQERRQDMCRLRSGI